VNSDAANFMASVYARWRPLSRHDDRAGRGLHPQGASDTSPFRKAPTSIKPIRRTILLRSWPRIVLRWAERRTTVGRPRRRALPPRRERRRVRVQ
jgi:hypothetical protein